MGYNSPDRNYDGIRFGEIRSVIEKPFTDFDDALSKAYYGKLVFDNPAVIKNDVQWVIDFGELRATDQTEAKRIFDELCGLNWWNLELRFHEYNMALPLDLQIPEDKYNFEYDMYGSYTGSKTDRTYNLVQGKKLEGLEIRLVI